MSFSETSAGRNIWFCQLLLSTNTVGPLNLAGSGKLLVAAKSFSRSTYCEAFSRSICFHALDIPHWVVKEIFGGPGLPFRVVMITTPFAAADPYMAVEEASFRMVMFSIS